MRFQHGIERVIDDVQENLFDLVRIGHDRRERFLYLAFHPNVVHAEVIITQRQGFVEHSPQVDFRFLRLALPGKREQVLHHAVGSLGLFEQLADKILSAFAQPLAFEQLRVAEDRGERIVELVGDAGNQLPHRRHLLALQELFLRQAKVLVGAAAFLVQAYLFESGGQLPRDGNQQAFIAGIEFAGFSATDSDHT